MNYENYEKLWPESICSHLKRSASAQVAPRSPFDSDILSITVRSLEQSFINE